MSTRTRAAIPWVSLLILALLAADVAAQRGRDSSPSRGGSGGGSSGGGSRGSSAPSRPSAPSSAPSRGSSGSFGSAAQGRGQASPPSRPSAPAPAPRVSAPRESPSSGGNAGSGYSGGGYSGGSRAPDAPRVQPAPSTPRYLPRDAGDSGRVAPRVDDGSSRRDTGRQVPEASGGGYDAGPAAPSARRDGGRGEARLDGANRDAGGRRYEPAPAAPSARGAVDAEAPRYDAPRAPTRVWQPRGETIDLGDSSPTPRTRVPVLAGSTSGPGAGRLGGRSLDPHPLDTRGGRALETAHDLANLTPAREITREKILERYRGTPVADATRGARDVAPSTPELSRARAAGRLTPVEPAIERPRSEPAAGLPATSPAARGSVEAARREREGIDRLDHLRRRFPERAAAFDAAARAASAASGVATGVAISLGGSACSNAYAGWFWNPYNGGYPYHGGYANHCWSPSWFWGSCSWGWPWWGYGYGFGVYGSHWGLYWGGSHSYAYAPYWGSYWGSYCASPTTYTTVIYQDDPDPEVVYVEREPAAAGEGVILAGGAEGGRVVGERRAGDSEVALALARGTTQYLDLGDEAFRSGRYADAVHHYARAVEYSPDQGVLYLILSDALFAAGDYHYAAYALRRALELDPKLMTEVVDKHGYYGDPAQFDAQIALAEDYVREHWLDDDARLVLAVNYLFAKRPAQCSDLLSSAFSKAVRESPEGQLVFQRAEALRQGE